MAFRKQYRKLFVAGMANKYLTYWHTVHPLTFDPIELIYRRAFTDKEWSALQLLRERRGEVIKSHSFFEFHPSSVRGIEGGIPETAHISFHLPEDMPSISIADNELPPKHLREILRWTIIAYRHKAEKMRLRSVVNFLMCNSTINTPGQLLHVWPGLVSHLSAEYRSVLRLRKNKSQPPYGWTPKRIAEFQGSDEFERLDHVLTVLSLTDYKKDDNYPVIC